MNVKIQNIQVFALMEVVEEIYNHAHLNQDVLQDSIYVLIKHVHYNVIILFSKNALRIKCLNVKIKHAQLIHNLVELELHVINKIWLFVLIKLVHLVSLNVDNHLYVILACIYALINLVLLLLKIAQALFLALLIIVDVKIIHVKLIAQMFLR